MILARQLLRREDSLGRLMAWHTRNMASEDHRSDMLVFFKGISIGTRHMSGRRSFGANVHDILDAKMYDR